MLGSVKITVLTKLFPLTNKYTKPCSRTCMQYLCFLVFINVGSLCIVYEHCPDTREFVTQTVEL